MKQKVETCGKLAKITRIEYNITPAGIEKLATLSKKCNIKTINDFTSTMLIPIQANTRWGVDMGVCELVILSHAT